MVPDIGVLHDELLDQSPRAITGAKQKRSGPILAAGNHHPGCVHHLSLSVPDVGHPRDSEPGSLFFNQDLLRFSIGNDFHAVLESRGKIPREASATGIVLTHVYAVAVPAPETILLGDLGRVHLDAKSPG